MPRMAIEDSFIDAERKLSYYDLVLPFFMMAKDGSPVKFVGTCFPIGVGIYLTAAHNFEGFQEARRRYGPQTSERTLPTPQQMAERLKLMREDQFLEGADVNCGALILSQSAIRRGKMEIQGFSLVTSVLLALDFDLAVLLVADDTRRNPELESTPIACFSLVESPRVGQKVKIAGFPGDANVFRITEKAGETRYSFGLSLVVNDGEITTLYPEMRDSGHAFFPCMHTSAEILPGHSGGPAICYENLSVVGINSIGGIAGGIISWVGKALDAELVAPIGLKIGDRTVVPGEATSLRKMADANLIQIYEN